MLKTLDVLIGLTVIMLALSMAVTMVTQFMSTVINSRGRHLKRGLVQLLGQLDPALEEKIADSVATAVLKHPLITNTFGGLGSVVHREEFTKLLLGLAHPTSSLPDEAKAALTKALKNNGIDNPDEVLKRIRAVSLQLEASNPELAANARQTIAILQEARSDFVGKTNAWFDQTIDRVSQRFTASTRAITFVSALIIAVALQVDTVSLVNRLSADDSLRNAFIERAKAIQSPAPEAKAATVDVDYLNALSKYGLITIADSPQAWRQRWGNINVFGVLLTSLLLSLGAPFWYNALGRLLQLRSALADKDDQQRSRRQTETGGPASSVTTAIGGQRGGLATVG